MLDKETSVERLLNFYMGKNTPNRQKFIINNLKVEIDLVEEEDEEAAILIKNNLLTTNAL
jgi:topoisomerase-4 subunit B